MLVANAPGENAIAGGAYSKGQQLSITDLKYAARLLLTSPWFTLLTVLVLSGGLGISIYAFSALNMMLYRALPLEDGDSIVRIGVGAWPSFGSLDAFELAEIRAEAESVRELGAYRTTTSLVGAADARRTVLTTQADWGIFDFTRTPALLGRGFVRDDSSAGAEPVAVLGHATWQSVFAGDPNVIGELVTINGRRTRIVGIMPEGYGFPMNAGMWLPLSRQELEPSDYTGKAFDAYARLGPGASKEAAEAELTALQRTRQQLRVADAQSGDAVSVLTFQEAGWGSLRIVVFGVLNALSLSILLLAAVNVGNLLLARTNSRIKEIGVRVALGAPRLRLIIQATLENVILCAIGGLLAIFLAKRALTATGGFMDALLPDRFAFWWTWRLGREDLAAAVLFLLLTVVVVSVLPAFSVSRADPHALLKDSTRGGGGLSTGRISRALVTAEVALISAVMLVGSAVAVIAHRTANFDFGMDTADAYMMGIELPAERYTTDDARLSAYQRILTELRATPGIDAAAVMQQTTAVQFAIEGREYRTPKAHPGAWLVVFSESPSPIGPPLIGGRAFDSRDSATGLKTAIISESLASAHWPNQSALGRRIEVSTETSEAEQRVIVGVVGDVNFDPADMFPIGRSAIYVPLTQWVTPSTTFAVRHYGGEGPARAAMYEAVNRVDQALAPNITSYASALGSITLFARTLMKLFMVCGAFAILLAITGIYGMSSNAVVLRAHEIGLRRALGASNGNVVGIFMAQGGRQLTVGLSSSAVLSVVLLFLIRQSFSMETWTLALIGAAVVLVVSGSVLLSTYLSVRGVIRREPSAALRYG
jgi:predicted permease